MRLGYDDYDQLYFGIKQFQALLGMVPDGTPGSRARTIRTLHRGLRHFVERRLDGSGKTEMLRFLQVIATLCTLFEANPEGDCNWPADVVSFSG